MEAATQPGRRFSESDGSTARLRERLWGISCVWRRYFDVYRKNLFYAAVTTFAEPVLYACSFGFGLGAIVGQVTVDGMALSYRQFILSGILAQSVMFQGFFEAAYGGFIRMYYQRIFKAMAMTPITLGEVLCGELLWDASKGFFSAVAVLTLGCVLGDFSWKGSLAVLPACFLGALLFAGLGLWMAAIAKSIESLSYPQYLLVFPMFLFCGIYFPLNALPHWLQLVAWGLPLTPLVSLMRTAVLGVPFQPLAVPLLLAWLVLLTWVAFRKMTSRLVK